LSLIYNLAMSLQRRQFALICLGAVRLAAEEPVQSKPPDAPPLKTEPPLPTPDVDGRIGRKVKQIIVAQLGEVTGFDERLVTDAARFVEDLGATSFDLCNLVMAYEEAFEIEIPDKDAEHIITVGDAIRYIPARIEAEIVLRSQVRAQILGVWKLRRVEALRPDGRTFLPLREHVTATLAYLDSGDFVESWARVDRPPTVGLPAQTRRQYRAMVERYFSSRSGTFELLNAGASIVHHINKGVQPFDPFGTLFRPVELDGDTLALTESDRLCLPAFAGQCAEGETASLRLTWNRSR